MSIPVVLGGNPFNIPEKGDSNYSTGASGLNAFFLQIITSINAGVPIASVVDNLLSVSTTSPLSANQGRLLNLAKINIADIVNALNSTSTVAPLSAAQGKVLQDTKESSSGTVSSPGSNVTLTATSDKDQSLNPSANIDVMMPAATNGTGERWTIRNRSLLYVITIKASGGTVITTLPPKSYAQIENLDNTPTVNTDWVTNEAGGGEAAYTPVYTGFGTVVSDNAYGYRDGAFWCFREHGTLGTLTAVEARSDLPFGLVSSANIATTESIGNFASGSSGIHILQVLSEASKSYITFGYFAGASGFLSKMLGNEWLVDSVPFSLFGKVAIAGWEIN